MALSTHSRFYFGLKVTTQNRFIDFQEGVNVRLAELNLGSYTGLSLAAEVKRAMDAVGLNTYSVGYNRTTRKITISSSGAVSLLASSGVNSGLSAYTLLGLETYFTAGEKEVRAWTIAIGATAPQAAGVIHTDFEKGFIRAEVIAFNEYVNHKGEQGSKEAGKMRLEGKEYVVKDGDVMHFRFNV